MPRSSSTGPASNNGSPAIRRRRAKSSDGLEPPSFIVPGALSSVSDYTPQRLLERYDYAEARLNSFDRKPTPNTAKMLKLYRNACMDMHLEYETLSEDDRLEKAEEIRGFDEEISKKTWIRENHTSKLMDDMLKLRKLTYWARYGDYAAHMASALRKGAGAAPPSTFAAKISGQRSWTDISAAIQLEEQEVAKNGFQNAPQVATTYAVWEACGKLAVDFKHMVQVIHMYAERNKAFHSGFKEKVERGSFAEIARFIFDDLSDLASVCPPELSDQEDAMRALLEELRDTWFDASSVPNNPSGWNWKPALQEMNDSRHQSQALRDQMAQTVAVKAANRLLAVDEQIDLLKQAVERPVPGRLPADGPGSPKANLNGKPLKRKASKAIDVSDRKKAWRLIEEQQFQAHTSATMALKTQRKVNRTVSTYKRVYGEEPPRE